MIIHLFAGSGKNHEGFADRLLHFIDTIYLRNDSKGKNMMTSCFDTAHEH